MIINVQNDSQTPRIQGTEEQQRVMDDIYHQFNITTSNAHSIVQSFIEEMKRAFDHKDASLSTMIPSFVTSRPTGKENGKYLVLELGDNDICVYEFEFIKGEYKVNQHKYIISHELKRGDVCHLFDFMAECLDSFIFEQGTDTNQLGFAFSFPVQQTAIDRGKLIRWTKGFACGNAIQKDVVALLQDAFLRKNLEINIAALVNDTVGTLVAHTYLYPQTSFAITLGTGTNAAYFKKLDQIKKEMVVNIEWGAFDPERKVLPYTIYDHKLNRESVEPDQQPFEKMISNLYLGEIVRNVILSLVDLRLIFSGQSSQELNQAGALTNSLPSILADRSEDLEETSRVLEELEISTVWVDRQMVKCISSWVVSRAARLTACGVAAILSDSLQKEPTRIAIGGSVYELFPDFEKQLLDNLDELLGGLAKDVQLDLVRENIGLGAAIIALMAHQASLLQGPLR